MFGVHDFALFVVAGILLNLTPGPDTLYVVTRSASHGLRAGLIAALGIGSGCFVHIFAAAIGLSALIAASATTFNIVRWLGAGYLIYIGVSLLRSRRLVAQPTAVATEVLTDRRIYTQGFLTNALNPKVALFFVAFLPQFIAPAATHKTLAFLLLGLVFNINGTLWLLLVAVMTATVAARAARLASLRVWRNRGIGLLFVALGARLGWVG